MWSKYLVSIFEMYMFTLLPVEFYEQSVLWTADCILCSHPESDALKSADDLKWNANKYVIIWLSKWQMSTNSVFG